MKITDISRKNTRKTIEELKSKAKITSNMLKEIRTTKLQKLQSDYEDYIGVVSTRSPKLQQIVDEIRTKASDFCQLEMEPILEFVGRLECLRDSYTKTCTQLVHILRKKNDVMFLSTNKLLQKDLDNLEEIPQMIQPKTLDEFQHGDFFNLPDLVKFTIGYLIEKQNEITELTKEVLKQKSKSIDLEWEKYRIQTKLDEYQRNIEQYRFEKQNEITELTKEVLKQKSKSKDLEWEKDRLHTKLDEEQRNKEQYRFEKQNEITELTKEVLKQQSKSKDLEMEIYRLQRRNMELSLNENKKAMQSLKKELPEEKANRYGLEQTELDTRELREEIQGRPCWSFGSRRQVTFAPIPTNMDTSMTEIPNKWDKKTNTDREKQREHVVKYDTGINDEQIIIVSAKRWNSSFESSGSKGDEKDSKQPFADTNDIQHVEYKHIKGRLVYRCRNDTNWNYVD
ncbi:putative leucine-rich repeat-containing protein DDB_G0290503 [Mytilus edulis]|uniref:putative leucine-rich repeat-containing protein DDB_G0290503 n=1 Tax=Mytilus edulis TaxID=6550 RepID=UPI0039EF345C